KLYMGGVRENEDWTIRVDTNIYSPWLGETYANFARIGLAFQRSQNAGRVDHVNGPAYAYYKRLASRVDAPAKEMTFFDGIDTRPAWYEPIGRSADEAMRAFSITDPSRCAPTLARGLVRVREERARATDPDIVYRLDLKEREFVDAINAAVGIEFTAIAQTATPVIPGEAFDVQVHFASRGIVATDPPRVEKTVPFTAGARAEFTQPHFHRGSLADNRYSLVAAPRYQPWPPAPS